MPKAYKIVAVLASTAAAGFSGAVIADAANSNSSAASTTPTATSPGPGHGGPGHRGGPGSGETALTGDTKTKVEAAALAKVPGTVVRSETDYGGVYEAHVRRSDGTEVEVEVDKAFQVTDVNEVPAGGRGARGGPGGGHGGGHDGGPRGDTAAVAKALDVTEAKLRSALEAARPAKTADQKSDRAEEHAAPIAKALGVDTADVVAVLKAARPDRGRGARGDDSALVSALAQKFAVTEAKAQAAVDAARKAHEADRTDREAAFYAAVAKGLGKSTADVQKAFEVNRPAKPTR